MKAFLFSTMIFLVGLTSVASWDLEQRKIDFLINSIENLNATFIRNGSEYTGPEAAHHLRQKVQAGFSSDPNMADQATAELFIEQIASKSFFTGRPYYIRFPDGTTVTSRDWLYQQLRLFH